MMDFLYGEINPTPPPLVAPPEAWPEYGRLADPMGLCTREEVGQNPRGIRWSLWPLTFEEYISDTEHDLAASQAGKLARNRLIIWKRIRGGKVPPGWRQASQKPWRIDGYHDLALGPDYTARWHKNARREAHLWHEEHAARYHIEEISLEEFCRAYRASLTAKKAGAALLAALVRMHALPARENIVLWGVRNKKTGDIIAGTAAIFSPTHKSSVRFCPFMLPEARHCYASVALVDHWFAHAQATGIQYLLFTCFWQAGDPKGWRGPAEFKSHFGLSYIAYPPELTRFVVGKIF
jgi:hypothetical protein